MFSKLNEEYALCINEVLEDYIDWTLVIGTSEDEKIEDQFVVGVTTFPLSVGEKFTNPFNTSEHFEIIELDEERGIAFVDLLNNG